MKKISLRILTFSLLMGSLPANAAIKVGAVYCNSGEQAALDEPSWRGAQLAVVEVNKGGGIRGEKVELIRISGNSSISNLKDNVAASLKENQLVGMVGLSDSDLALAAAPQAVTQGIPFVTSGATSPKLPTAVGAGFYMACFGDNVQAAAAAEWLLQAKGARTVSIIYDPAFSYTRLLKTYFSKAFQHSGGKIVSTLPYKPGLPLILGPATLKADAVYLVTESAEDAMPVIRQLRSRGFPGPIVGGDSYDNPPDWTANPAANNVYYTTHAFAAVVPGSANRSAATAFSRSYKKAFHTDPDSFSALGYDATKALLAGIEKSTPANPKSTLAAFASGIHIAGLTGPIILNKSQPVPKKPVALVEASDPLNRKLQFTPTFVPAP
jgi:branched-chain amino acid transport system substrate-binding protein